MLTLNHAHVSRAQDYDVAESDWGRLTWFVSSELGNSDTLTVGRCEIRPGCENPMHLHPNCDEVLHVLAGEISHRVEGETDVPMRAGDTISIQPNVRHNARNTGATDAVLLICFSSANRQTRGE